jgi:hypothetical protein
MRSWRNVVSCRPALLSPPLYPFFVDCCSLCISRIKQSHVRAAHPYADGRPPRPHGHAILQHLCKRPVLQRITVPPSIFIVRRASLKLSHLPLALRPRASDPALPLRLLCGNALIRPFERLGVPYRYLLRPTRCHSHKLSRGRAWRPVHSSSPTVDLHPPPSPPNPSLFRPRGDRLTPQPRRAPLKRRPTGPPNCPLSVALS